MIRGVRASWGWRSRCTGRRIRRRKNGSSDWGSEQLSEAQVAYAASDVLHLHQLRDKLDAMLVRAGREGIARACFEFLPTRSRLDLLGWGEEDIFAHS